MEEKPEAERSVAGSTDDVRRTRSTEQDFGVFFDAVQAVIADASRQAADGNKLPISGRVGCPKCGEALGLHYTYEKPRSARAACNCGFSFMS
jgi:hypothetical protein